MLKIKRTTAPKLKKDFKIIAIRPLQECDNKLTKVLQKERTYYFYNDYHIDGDKVSHINKSPDDLYHHQKLKIQISAIAGQNGSGKSTLIELLFMAINNIAYNNQSLQHSLTPVNKLHVALYIKTDRFLKILIRGAKIEVIQYKDGKSTNYSSFDLNDLFYTIAINYSHYAYNASDYRKGKDWISPLFHKNDGYQTPIVLSPMRTKGNIDINTENKLVNQRLVTNILRPFEQDVSAFRRLTDNLSATDIVLKLNRNKNKGILYKKNGEKIYLKDLHIDKELMWETINKFYDFRYEEIDRQSKVNQIALDYLICKLISISENYSEYQELYSQKNGDFNWTIVKSLLPKLLREKSHISFKLIQTIHFLKYPELGYMSGIHSLDTLSDNIQAVIDQKKTYKLKIISLIPPPIYITEVILSQKNKDQKRFSFNTLSSGEKQMIYSLSSILYHLFNLDSIVSKSKIVYRNINILLEEIELYFHPEMQRNYVSYLRDSIIRLDLERIRMINICFVTHSPFILSDIPDKNVMFLKLEEGRSIQTNLNKKTFGANIHDLLADGFFMEQGFCGALAMERINETIGFLNFSKRLKELTSKPHIDRLKQAGIDVSERNEPNAIELRNQEIAHINKILAGDKKEEHLKIIKSIGETVIAKKLMEMYTDIFHDSYEDKIKSEIARLQQLLGKP